MQSSDVLVVGKGNAALCVALSAREAGVRVTMLEAASHDEAGGNSAFAGGVMRFAFGTVEELKRVTELSADEITTSDFGTNTEDEYFAREDIEKVHKLAVKQSQEMAAKEREALQKLHYMHCPKCGFDLHRR